MQKPIAPVFTWPADEPHLVGSKCQHCAAVTFPAQSRCPRCSRPEMAELHASPARARWSHGPPRGSRPSLPYAGDPTGASFEPFGVGLVQLDDVVRVESRLTESDPAKLDFGMDGRADDRPVLRRRERRRDHDLRVRADNGVQGN